MNIEIINSDNIPFLGSAQASVGTITNPCQTVLCLIDRCGENISWNYINTCFKSSH
jgi:hypothetical protein